MRVCCYSVLHKLPNCGLPLEDAWIFLDAVHTLPWQVGHCLACILNVFENESFPFYAQSEFIVLTWYRLSTLLWPSSCVYESGCDIQMS